jgi:hypothetical protein
VNHAVEDISSNPAGTILITYFREFPTLPMGNEPPYGRWLARSFNTPVTGERWLAGSGWRRLFGK